MLFVIRFRNDIHKRFLQDCLGNDPDVLFIGDSILESLQFTEIWNQLFSPLHCLNFSLRNDLVQNVLWRLKNGELEHVKPKVRTSYIDIYFISLQLLNQILDCRPSRRNQ